MVAKLLRKDFYVFKILSSQIFSNLFQRDCLYVLLEDKQKGKFGGVDIPWI